MRANDAAGLALRISDGSHAMRLASVPQLFTLTFRNAAKFGSTTDEDKNHAPYTALGARPHTPPLWFGSTEMPQLCSLEILPYKLHRPNGPRRVGGVCVFDFFVCCCLLVRDAGILCRLLWSLLLL